MIYFSILRKIKTKKLKKRHQIKAIKKKINTKRIKIDRKDNLYFV